MADNFFLECPPMMEDGRLFTDYRSSQVREEVFRHKHCVLSENEARTLRIEHADEIMDEEWEHIRDTKSCFPKKNCYHRHPRTRTSTAYNNAEILAYNGKLPSPPCEPGCHDYRVTVTKGSKAGRQNCKPPSRKWGYPADRCPKRCKRSQRLLPDGLYVIDGKY
jgi:hypothetical protein